MRVSFLWIVLVIAMPLMQCDTADNYTGEEYIIENVSVISLSGSVKVDLTDVVVRADSIFQIGEYDGGDSSTIIDGTGKFLLPGLTEMHAHIPVATEANDTLVRETLFLYLSQGVTTIRGMLGDPYHLVLKEMISEDKILSPRVYTSSPSVNGNSVTSVEEAKEKIKSHKELGYDFLKIHPGVQLDVWDQIEETAKEVGIGYAGHVPVEVGIHRALDAGYETIDHIDGFIDGLIPSDVEFDRDGGGFFGYSFTDLVDTSLISSLVAKTKANNVAVVPTQTLFTRWFSPEDPAAMLQQDEMKYMPAKTRFTWRQNKERMITNEEYNEDTWQKYVEIREQILREMDKQGVDILLGSDAPQVMNVPGFSIHHEMKAMADAGLSNERILESGTSAPAKFFNAKGEYGVIEEGASADFILLEENPLDKISHAKSIQGVMLRGKWISRKEIDERLSEIATRNQ